MKELMLTFALLRAGDLATTQHILRADGVEHNPMLPQRPTANLIVGAATTAGEMAGLHWLDTKNHTAAKWLTIAAIAVEGFAVAHNSAQIVKR